jgi:ATP-dependent helicase YprA (DUF1998 family)
MGSYEPISASIEILDSVQRYLQSSFNPRRLIIAREFERAIEEGRSNKDIGGALYREVRRKFATGKSLEEFASEGIVHPNLVNFTPFVLHAHQSRALELATGKSRNIIVATGTGSGKTEAFLLPIVDSLLKERDAGTLSDGIRALIVYPMNALATDQLDRLEKGLKPYPEISFGRFVGPTKKTRKEAERARGANPFTINERASREEMVARPPHILITNYAMLERLLLLPEWDNLFTGQMKWAVMDEVHSYDGSRALEISMLIRRLKSRTGSSAGVQCIAASATLGDPNSDLDSERAAVYATNLFGEKFEKTDLIRPEYEDLTIPKDPIDILLPSNTHLIEKYKADDFGAYHLFIRNPGGAFICLSNNHPEHSPRIRLQSHRNCDSCSMQGYESRLAELGACRKCGVEYLIGKKLHTGEIVIADESDENAQYFRLISADINTWADSERSLGDVDEVDEEEDSLLGTTAGKWWCVICSQVNSSQTCRCGQKCTAEIGEALRPNKTGKLKCDKCGSPGERSPFGPILRPVSGVDALTSVIATSIYQNLPKEDSLDGAGKRKLLAFSDNRQDAAYFAPYLKSSYFDLVRRRVINAAIVKLEDSSYSESPFDLAEVSASMKRFEDSIPEYAISKMWSWTWMRGELVSTDIGISLTDTGILKFSIPKKKMTKTITYLMSLDINADESYQLANALLKTAMYDGAVELPDGVDPADEVFSPREKPVYLNCIGVYPTSKAWISESTVGNKRTNIISRIFASEKSKTEEILTKLWETLSEDGVLLVPKDGLRAISNDAIVVERTSGEIFKCTKCRRYSQWTLPGQKCPTKNCIEGILETFKIPENNHYRFLFENLDIAALNSKEHTAQWTAEEAELVQEEFITGKVNVLSCSTTFEMGVDIGSIVSVLCRNVPPSPANYVQRAGRAGRRQGDKALIVTFARRRSHDTQYVSNPLMLIKGTIPVPSLSLENIDLVRRHIFAIALSLFLRESNFIGTRSDDFFESDNDQTSISRKFKTWLDKKPENLLEEIFSLELPSSVLEKIGVGEWRWASILDEVDVTGRGAWLAEIEKQYFADMDGITEIIATLATIKETSAQAGRRSRLLKIKEDLQRRQIVEPLANGGILPKYGFPVDVASLVPSFASPQQANKIELSRDLSMAIAEYGPGSQVVAGGHVLTSKGIRRPANATFGSMTFISYTCDDCGWFWHALAPEGRKSVTAQKTQCESCGKLIGRENRKFFIQPRYGFIAYVDNRSAGMNARPKKASSATSYVSSGNINDENWVKSGPLSYSISHESQLLTLSTKEFSFCDTCGFAQPLENGRLTKHKDPRNDKECNSTFAQNFFLGHEFKTDVIRLRFEGALPICECLEPGCLGALESASAAIVSSSARALGISNADLNSSVQTFVGDINYINIFDTTPGGIGMTLAISQRLDEILLIANQLTTECPNCHENSSCYACLRSYSNQRRHDHLSRFKGLDVISRLLG